MWHFIIAGGAVGTDNIIIKSTPSYSAPFPSSSLVVFETHYVSKSNRRINHWKTKNSKSQLCVLWWLKTAHENAFKMASSYGTCSDSLVLLNREGWALKYEALESTKQFTATNLVYIICIQYKKTISFKTDLYNKIHLKSSVFWITQWTDAGQAGDHLILHGQYTISYPRSWTINTLF